MYQMISSDIVSEIPLHLGLALCGALGYAVSKYANGLCPYRRGPAKVVEEVEKPQPDNSEKKQSQAGARAGRRSKAQKSSTQGATFTGNAEVAPEALPEVTVASETVPETSSAVLSTDQSDALPQPVSERVKRLMAKKAERKARKQELLLIGEHKQVESHSTVCMQVVESLDLASEEEQGEDQVCDSKPGNVEVASEEMQVERQGDEELISEIDHSLEPELATDEADHSLEPDLETDKDLDLACDDCCIHAIECNDVDVAIAELSTSDEALVPVCEEQEDSSCDDTAVECIQDQQGSQADSSDEEEFVDHPYHTTCGSESYHDAFCARGGELWASTWQKAVGAPVNDGWMCPFDELIRSHEQAEHVYCGAPVHELQFLPVVCVNNQQQFYTDGEQVYMLACIEAPEDSDAPRLLRPVVDVNDPLHMEFSQDLHTGVIQLPPGSDESKVQVVPFEANATFSPAWSTHQELWDVCWDVAM